MRPRLVRVRALVAQPPPQQQQQQTLMTLQLQSPQLPLAAAGRLAALSAAASPALARLPAAPARLALAPERVAASGADADRRSWPDEDGVSGKGEGMGEGTEVAMAAAFAVKLLLKSSSRRSSSAS